MCEPSASVDPEMGKRARRRAREVASAISEQRTTFPVDARSLPFFVLPRLQAQATEFYKDGQEQAGMGGASRRARTSARLRGTDPW